MSRRKASILIFFVLSGVGLIAVLVAELGESTFSKMTAEGIDNGSVAIEDPYATDLSASSARRFEGSWTPEDEQALAFEQQRWLREHGHYMDFSGEEGIVEQTHPYTALDDESLQVLVDSLDMVAASVLADRLMGSQNPVEQERALRLHRKAAVLGSTYSSGVLGTEILNIAGSGQPIDDVNTITDGLAWQLFTAKRGDPIGRISAEQYLDVVEIDESVLAIACQKADLLMQQANQERSEIGLPFYENSAFPGIRKAEKDGWISSASICPSH